MITLKQLIEAFRDKLLDNVTLNTWCQENFSKDLTVFVGIDLANPPAKEHFPLVVIHPSFDKTGQEVDEFKKQVMVDWGIENNKVNQSGSLVEYPGVYQADELGQLIWQELKTVSDNIALSQNHYEIEPIMLFPKFMGIMDITIDIPNVMGGSIEL